jgi:hypothetical protein
MAADFIQLTVMSIKKITIARTAIALIEDEVISAKITLNIFDEPGVNRVIKVSETYAQVLKLLA